MNPIPALLLLAACGPGGDSAAGDDTDTPDRLRIEAGFESVLAHQGGCADVVLYRWAPDDTLALFFRTQGAVQAAHAAGVPTTTGWTLPDPAVELLVQAGEHVSHVTCDDILEFEVVVERSWTAVAGTASLTITPTGEATEWEMPALGELVLGDVVLEPDDGGDPVPLPSLTISSGVGWFPG